MLYVGDSLSAHANGGCYTCGRGDRLVDLGIQIVGEGALVLCVPCITEAAEAAELTFNDARVRELEAEVQRLHPARLAELEAELEQTRAALQDEERLSARLQGALQRRDARPVKASA